MFVVENVSVSQVEQYTLHTLHVMRSECFLVHNSVSWLRIYATLRCDFVGQFEARRAIHRMIGFSGQ